MDPHARVRPRRAAPSLLVTARAAVPLLATALACASESAPTDAFVCESGTCIRLATETPAFDPTSSTTHYPNAQHTPRTFADFAWDVEDEAHVSPEAYDRSGDFFIQSTNTGFASFFAREFGFVPEYFLRFAAGVTVQQVDGGAIRDLERFNIPLRAPDDAAFSDRFAFPLGDGFLGGSLFFRTFNQGNPALPRFCALTLERIEIRSLPEGNQRVEADLRYRCGLRAGEREIRRF